MIFSFELGGASAQLTYDDVAGTAKIEGTMVRSLAGGGSGLTWNVIYEMSGVENVGTGCSLIGSEMVQVASQMAT